MKRITQKNPFEVKPEVKAKPKPKVITKDKPIDEK